MADFKTTNWCAEVVLEMQSMNKITPSLRRPNPACLKLCYEQCGKDYECVADCASMC
jgi:hypothetical protein